MSIKTLVASAKNVRLGSRDIFPEAVRTGLTPYQNNGYSCNKGASCAAATSIRGRRQLRRCRGLSVKGPAASLRGEPRSFWRPTNESLVLCWPLQSDLGDVLTGAGNLHMDIPKESTGCFHNSTGKLHSFFHFDVERQTSPYLILSLQSGRC